MPKYDELLTVGVLAEYHESDLVLYEADNLLFRVQVVKENTAAGVAVLLARGASMRTS